MTQHDALALFNSKCDEKGQSKVAAELGYSPSTVSQIRKNTYRGNLDNVLARVVEVYGGLSVACPVLGDIPLSRCAEERRKPFAATNQQRVQLFAACQKCPQNGGRA